MSLPKRLAAETLDRYAPQNHSQYLLLECILLSSFSYIKTYLLILLTLLRWVSMEDVSYQEIIIIFNLQDGLDRYVKWTSSWAQFRKTFLHFTWSTSMPKLTFFNLAVRPALMMMLMNDVPDGLGMR